MFIGVHVCVICVHTGKHVYVCVCIYIGMHVCMYVYIGVHIGCVVRYVCTDMDMDLFLYVM